MGSYSPRLGVHPIQDPPDYLLNVLPQHEEIEWCFPAVSFPDAINVATQPQSMQLPLSGSSATNSLKEEHGKRIQELQIWVQALNGGTSALVDPRNWENPLLGIQAEQNPESSMGGAEASCILRSGTSIMDS